MAEPTWLGYAGAITGIVGAIAGGAGAVMGFISYRHSKELKALDLRLELRKTVSDLHSDVEDLSKRLEYAKKSHAAISAATGLRGSGAMQKWMTAWSEDSEALKVLQQKLPDDQAKYAGTTPSELESLLVEVHAHRTRVARLSEKYASELVADDRARDELRKDLRVRTQARLDGKL